MLVLYGSETGNAAELAEVLGDRIRRMQIDCKVLPFGMVSVSDLQANKYVFVVCSTTGQGVLPGNAYPLWTELLKASLARDTLQSVRFGAFGVGDNAYKQFNWAIRKIYTRFVQLGATSFVARSEGDEQNPDGVEIVFDQWMDNALQVLATELKIEDILPVTAQLPPKYKICFGTSPKVDKALLKAKVAANDRITAPDHFQDVRHIKLDPEHPVKYEPGAVAYLYPSNVSVHVDALLDYQGWNDIADKELHVDEKWVELLSRPLVQPVTLRSLFTWHLDLNGIPRRSFFKLASNFCSGNEAERLAEFATTEGIDDLYNYANRPRRSVIETILEFESIKIPFEYILDLFPLIWPRAFSIASPTNQPTIELCVALVKYKTILKRGRKGLCSRYIETLLPGDEIGITIEPAPISIESKLQADQAVILVAAGTGIAPVRSLLHTLKNHKAPIFLFFGCRFEHKDYLYGEEWKQMAEATDLTVFNAFSREGGGYVQNQIEAAAEKITAYLPTALVYLCGSSGSMPRAVREAFVDVLKRTRHLDEETAAKVMAYKEKHRTFIEETW
ncbi:NADPH-dependent diflavin oxidoreductase 1 [Wickerhamiella sorbophila]|uniref:NADPH-dependent diflavin oxidoreductase 1 n=1 Tax=Wickerhamiella sorbophila TaxID=45607 RepID=A0A2T0FN15_9ASCO|nr:NADPH-dependent diflavin oxidoreductase 1 [Wickerhamiella sorbophila]PRT56388.1 NADPH-dependent diflavin oxidoreductase 1 [Wickerhamiella sorbophila]